jgi:branched-chain amino acid transport system ATP-binding protein
VRGLSTGYGNKLVLSGVDLEVGEGEIVALIGHNGAGKSTLLKAIFGLLPIWSGELLVNGGAYPAPTPQGLLRLGVAHVPQGNRVFVDMTVRENLEMGGDTLRDTSLLKARVARACTLFPALAGRLRQRAGSLSGGERQMLAFSMGLMTSPRLLLLDEPSLGLSAHLVSTALALLRDMAQKEGVAMLVVEQKVREVLQVAHRAVVLRNGGVVFAGPAGDLKDEARLRAVYL